MKFRRFHHYKASLPLDFGGCFIYKRLSWFMTATATTTTKKINKKNKKNNFFLAMEASIASAVKFRIWQQWAPIVGAQHFPRGWPATPASGHTRSTSVRFFFSPTPFRTLDFVEKLYRRHRCVRFEISDLMKKTLFFSAHRNFCVLISSTRFGVSIEVFRRWRWSSTLAFDRIFRISLKYISELAVRFRRCFIIKRVGRLISVFF